MIIIDIPKDFTKTPGWRTYDDGPFSGQEFYDKLLMKSYQEAKNKQVKLKVILDGSNGYTTSFLNEAFRLLGEKFGADEVWDRLIIISNEVPKYIERVKKRRLCNGKKNKWRLLIAFFAGVLICFITTRFHYFEIKKELDVPGLVMGALGLIIGLYIADTIQKRINRNQNRYSYLESKIDTCWTEFSNLAKVISMSNYIGLESIAILNSEIIHQTGFIKNIFEAFEINTACICDLDSKLENFENLFDDIPTENNIKYYEDEKSIIETEIIAINQCFSKVLKTIQDIE